jgi:hypothetical protein
MFLYFSFFCGSVVKWDKHATNIDMFRVQILGRQEKVPMSKSKLETMLICLYLELSTAYLFLQPKQSTAHSTIKFENLYSILFI